MYYDDNVQFHVLCIHKRQQKSRQIPMAFSPNSHIYTNMPWAALNMQVILKQALLAL